MSATERALIRRVLDLEERVRLLEGDYQRMLALSKDGFLDTVASELPG